MLNKDSSCPVWYLKTVQCMTSWLFFSHSHGTLHITVLVFIKNTEDPIYANFSSSFPDCLLHPGILLSTQLPQTPLNQICFLFLVRLPYTAWDTPPSSVVQKVPPSRSQCNHTGLLTCSLPPWGHSLELPVVQNLKVVVSYIFLVSSCLR